MFIGTFIAEFIAEAETPILRRPDAQSPLIGKDPDAGKDRRLMEEGMEEDEMNRYHYQLNGREFELTPGDSMGWRSLVRCSSQGHKELDMTLGLNNNKISEECHKNEKERKYINIYFQQSSYMLSQIIILISSVQYHNYMFSVDFQFFQTLFSFIFLKSHLFVIPVSVIPENRYSIKFYRILNILPFRSMSLLSFYSSIVLEG